MKLKLNLKRLVLILFSFLLLSAPLFSDVSLTDQEMEEIELLLETLGKDIEKSSEIITSLETILERAEKRQLNLERLITIQSNLFQDLNELSKRSKLEEILNDLETFTFGVGAGYLLFKIIDSL